MIQRNNLPALSALVLLAGLAAGCNRHTPPPATAPPPPKVPVSQPEQRSLTEWDEYPGRVEALAMVEVRARVSGYLESIHFKDGDLVNKGDLLFVIDPRPYQADLDRASADLKQAETKFELASNDFARAEKLLKARAMSAEEADSRGKAKQEAGALIASAKALVEIAQLNLEYTRITAPISGRISRKMLTEGNLVNSSQGQSSLLTTIVSVDPVYCYFDAPEAAALKYQQLAREGKRAENSKLECQLELANETNFPHLGVLDFQDNHVDPATGTLRLRAIFPNPGPNRALEPGYFARVRVPGSASYQGLLIPDQAIQMDQGQKFVLAVNATNSAEYRKVILGPLYDGMRIIREGIQPGDWIIVNGLMAVRPNMPVDPVKPGEPPKNENGVSPSAPKTPAKAKP